MIKTHVSAIVKDLEKTFGIKCKVEARIALHDVEQKRTRDEARESAERIAVALGGKAVDNPTHSFYSIFVPGSNWFTIYYTVTAEDRIRALEEKIAELRRVSNA